jgi:3-hydroxyacyl-CoA dehydrogenase
MIAPEPIQYALDGRVAIVTLANPPVNTLSIGVGVVDSLSAAIMQVLSKAEVTAVVVMADGKLFSAGADIADFDRYPDTLERMRAFTTGAVESAAKPIVIAIHGAALGAGLELAIAGHYRICSADATFGLPEVTLGLLPGGGGTQRLPRLIGPSKALGMMLSGKAVGAGEALQLGLVDRITSDNLRSDAINWAATLDTVRRTCDRRVEGDFVPAIIDGRGKAKKARLSDAPRFIVDCVETACMKPFAEGMRVEAELFERLRLSESSNGLRHAFYARRRVAHIPGLPQNSGEHPINSVAIVGAGTMGTGIALSLVAGGFAVTLIETDAQARTRAAARIETTVSNDIAKGRLSPEGGAQLVARLSLASSIDAAATADLVIEAVFEDMAAKGSVFAQLDVVCKPTAIFASNTSTLDLNAIAELTARPERVIGMHFFSPANIMRLLEVVRGARTAQAVLAVTLSFAKKIKKTAVVAGVCDGFIGNRIFEEYLRQAYFLLEEGALPEQIDGALERWGMAMGPFRVMDLAGQDIGWSIRKRRAIEQPDRPYSKIPDLVCEQRRFGQKTGSGFYRSGGVLDAAIAAGYFRDQIVPIEFDVRRKPIIFDRDEHVRCDASLDGMAALRPLFRAGGSVTAGNSSGINDGAAALVLATGKAVMRDGLKPLARLVAYGVAGVDPAYMGMGPVPATRKALSRAGLPLASIDVIEANEAFAAQACAVARELDFNPAKVNPNGSGISLGHPVGATGAIITVKLLAELQRIGGRYGLVTMCIGGGQGIAAIFERL